MSDLDRRVAELDGLPRRNGELVFEAPWQGRAFGMAVALTKGGGGFEWEDFRSLLIAEIARAPRAEYYACWVSALERLLLQRSALTEEELTARTSEYLAQERDEVF